MVKMSIMSRWNSGRPYTGWTNEPGQALRRNETRERERENERERTKE